MIAGSGLLARAGSSGTIAIGVVALSQPGGNQEQPAAFRASARGKWIIDLFRGGSQEWCSQATGRSVALV